MYAIPKTSWGPAVTGVLIGAGCLYAGLGAIFGRRVLGQKTANNSMTGWLEAHPHKSKWLEVQALVQDGVAYSRARLQGHSHAQSSYQPLGNSAENQLQGLQSSSKTHKHSSKGKKETGSSKGKKRGGKNDCCRSGKGDSMVAQASYDSDASQRDASQRAVAAGGGGRWVKVG